MPHFFSNATIVLPYDFSDAANSAIDEALSVSDDTARLCLLHVLVPVHMMSVEPGIIFDLGDENERVSAAIESMKQLIPERDGRRIEYAARIGDPGSEIVDYAKQVSADLIVMSSHGRSGISRLLLGSVAERVLRLATCPVLIVRRQPHK